MSRGSTVEGKWLAGLHCWWSKHKHMFLREYQLANKDTLHTNGNVTKGPMQLAATQAEDHMNRASGMHIMQLAAQLTCPSLFDSDPIVIDPGGYGPPPYTVKISDEDSGECNCGT